jgi:hypothetical protein
MIREDPLHDAPSAEAVHGLYNLFLIRARVEARAVEDRIRAVVRRPELPGDDGAKRLLGRDSRGPGHPPPVQGSPRAESGPCAGIGIPVARE